MKRFISLILTLFVLATSCHVTAGAITEPTSYSATARFYLDEHISAGAAIVDKTAIKDITGLAEAGTGWAGPWSNYLNTTAVSTDNSVVRTAGVDNDAGGLYLGFKDSMSNFYRKLNSPIVTSSDGSYYACITMANSQSSASAVKDVKASFSLASSSITDSNKDVVTVSIDYLMSTSYPTLSVNGIATNAVLQSAYAYDILIKLDVDMNGADVLKVEWVEKGSDFTGNWNYETTLELGNHDIDFVHFGCSGFAAVRVKNVEVGTYESNGSRQIEDIVASANGNNYRECINQIKNLLPDDEYRDSVISEIMSNAKVIAYDYLEFDDYNIINDTSMNSNTAYTQGGFGWESDWTTASNYNENTLTQSNRYINPTLGKYFINPQSNGAWIRRWFHMPSVENQINRCEFGFTMGLLGGDVIHSTTGTPNEARFVIGSGKYSSELDEMIRVGMRGFAAGEHPTLETDTNQIFPYITVGNTTVVGTTPMVCNSHTVYRVALDITFNAQGNEIIRMKVMHVGTSYDSPMCDLLIDSKELGDAIPSYINLSSHGYGVANFGEISVIQKKNIFAVEEFSFINENNEGIDIVNNIDGCVGAKTTIQNLFDTAVHATLYIAIYKNNLLVAVSHDTKTVAAGETAVFKAIISENRVPGDIAYGDYTVRAFLLDDALTPYASFDELASGVTYISANASADGVGTRDNPFALEKAIENAKKLTSLGKKLPVYELAGGKYMIDTSITLNNFNFGTANNPFTLRAAEGEDVSFIGGISIPLSEFSSVTDSSVLQRLHPDAKDHIVRINLNDYGISEYGTLNPYGNLLSIYNLVGYPYGTSTQNELLFDGKRMVAARWPNDREAEIDTVNSQGTVMQTWRDDMEPLPEGWIPPEERNLDEVEGPGFTILDEKNEAPWQRWSLAEDIMLYGRLCWEWSDEGMPVSVSRDGVVTSDYPVSYGVRKGARFYLWNILEELDTPGEWYLDRESGEMYFYPPQGDANSVVISTLETPVLSIRNAQNICFEGFTVEGGKNHGISIINSQNITLDGLVICNMAKNGVYSEKLTACHIKNCEVYGCGEIGVTLDGGNQTTLERGNNLIINCHIYSNAELKETYSPGIRLTGCGNTASHNEIHDMPHAGIVFNGSYNTVEYNEIYDVVNNSNDMGAIYTYKSRTAIGSVIRHNYIHDLVPIKSNLVVNPMQPGIYLDGGRSFVSIESNIFENIGAMAVLQAGRANTIINNFFINVGYIMRTGCGTWGNDVTDMQLSGTGLMAVRNGTVDLSKPPYSQIPHLSDIMTDDPLASKHITYANNVLVNHARYYEYPWASADTMSFEAWKAHEDNNWTDVYKVTTDTAGFTNAAQRDYTLRTDSSIYTMFPDFAPVDFANVGRK